MQHVPPPATPVRPSPAALPPVAAPLPTDFDCELALCAETVGEGLSVLIFCATRDNCASTAKALASGLAKYPAAARHIDLQRAALMQIRADIQLDQPDYNEELHDVLARGIAFHHAGTCACSCVPHWLSSVMGRQ
jgi:replicative superfamily II helicase